MSRRLAGNCIKLEVFFGADRQTIIIRRNQDLVVRDIMEEVEKTFRIPIIEQVLFHKGNNLTDQHETPLEALGVENNHPIRINRDPEVQFRSPRGKMPPALVNPAPHQMNPHTLNQNQMNQNQMNQNQMNQNQMNQNQLDPKSYLKEISPGRVPDPTPYQVQVYNQQMLGMNNNVQNPEGPQDILKLNIAYGSERECVLIHGKKPLKIGDLKTTLKQAFKIPPENQCIVFKGYNIHEYVDEAPLSSFGLENNHQVNLWPKANNPYPDIRLPRAPDQHPYQIADSYNNTPRLNPQPQPQQRWPVNHGTTVKVQVEHGSDRHQILLTQHQALLTVLDLQNEIQNQTSVPVKEQRLFLKSQELNNSPYRPLADCEIENNTTVKLIGEPSSEIKYQNFFTTRPQGQHGYQQQLYRN